MAASADVNPLEEHITCNVCLEVYRDPHILTCLHTCCYQCIQGLKQQNRVQCPKCRTNSDINEIKKDFNMVTLIGAHKKMAEQSHRPRQVMCDLCKKPGKPIESHCLDCDEHLCADCDTAHRSSKASKNHKLKAFKELNRSQQEQMDEKITVDRGETQPVTAASEAETGAFQSRSNNDLPDLCNECLLSVANKTLGLQPVILVFAKVNRGFCTCLDFNIITKDMQQQIQRANNDSEAFGYIRQALPNSLEPRKLDIVLEVLSDETRGKKEHVDKIRKHYHEEICNHKRCKKCCEKHKK